MKNTLNILRIVALVAVVGLFAFSCSIDNDPGGVGHIWIPPAIILPDSDTVTITLHPNQTGVSSIEVEVTPGEPYEFPARPNSFPVPTGKVFGGWLLHPSDNVIRLPGQSYSPSEDTLWLANWVDPTPTTVQFRNDDDSIIESRNTTVGTEIQLAFHTGFVSSVNSAYRLLGWLERGNPEAEVLPAGTNNFLVYKENIIMDAVWEGLRTITFNPNGVLSGGTTIGIPQQAMAGTNLTLDGRNDAARTGFRFLGWSTNSANTNPDFLDGSLYPVTQDITLFAIWAPTLRVRFNTNYPTGSTPSFDLPDDISASMNISIELPDESDFDPSDVPTGMALAGWNISLDNQGNPNGRAFIPGEEFIVTQNNVILHAIWSPFTIDVIGSDPTRTVTITRPVAAAPTGVINIPPTINTWAVTEIGEEAFDALSGITGVRLPTGLLHIRLNAFRGTGLASVSIPAGVTVAGTATDETMGSPDKQDSFLIVYPIGGAGLYSWQAVAVDTWTRIGAHPPQP
ncbi:MAG: InlB B-repeat-containing protein [Spirochaetaceae bacterium]|nr:InlB B-repeat-containing protein [Spirochaetaceae bacterium]